MLRSPRETRRVSASDLRAITLCGTLWTNLNSTCSMVLNRTNELNDFILRGQLSCCFLTLFLRNDRNGCSWLVPQLFHQGHAAPALWEKSTTIPITRVYMSCWWEGLWILAPLRGVVMKCFERVMVKRIRPVISLWSFTVSTQGESRYSENAGLRRPKALRCT